MTIIEYFASAAVTGCVTSFVVVLLKKPGVFFRRGEELRKVVEKVEHGIRLQRQMKSKS